MSTSELPDNFGDLAQEYHDVIISGGNIGGESANTSAIDELNREVKNLETDIENYDSDHPLYPVLQDEYSEKNERLKAIQAETGREEALRAEFPNRIISDFATTEELLTEKVIQTVTHSLIGEARDEILIDQFRLTPQTDLERDEIIQATKGIHQVAEYQVSGENEIEEIWESLTGREKSIIRVLATANQELGPTNIAEKLDADVTKGAVSPKLGDDRDREFPLTFKGDNGYRLSLVGEFIWENCGSELILDAGNSRKDDDVDESLGNEPADGQLDEFTD